MSTAQARAEARRKAILSRGTDRLSKLTSSARGEDATYINTGVWYPSPFGERFDKFLRIESSITSKTVAVNTFVGEDPGRGSSEPPLLSAGGPPQPLQRAVSEDPNMELLNALMDAQQQRPGIPGSTTTFSDASSPFPVPTKPQSKLQKFLPLIHIISVWCLFAFFAIWKEPIVYSEHPLWQGKADSFWARWARLSPQSSRTPGETWQVQPVVRPYDFLLSIRILTLPQPFWGALATLELVLFSFRIFSGFVRGFSQNSSYDLAHINRRTRYPRPRCCRWLCRCSPHRCVPPC